MTFNLSFLKKEILNKRKILPFKQALYEAILRLDTRGKNYGTDKSTLIDEMFEKLPLFVTVKVGELLFGYRDATLEMISKVEENFRANGLKLVLPDSIQNGRYSVMGAVSFEVFDEFLIILDYSTILTIVLIATSL